MRGSHYRVRKREGREERMEEEGRMGQRRMDRWEGDRLPGMAIRRGMIVPVGFS